MQCGKKNVGYNGHYCYGSNFSQTIMDLLKREKGLTRNVQVRAVNIISRWHKLTLSTRFPRPRFMCPRKKHQSKFFDHIRIGDVKVMFDAPCRYECAELGSKKSFLGNDSEKR